jgi:hypothetical protein
MIETKLHNEIKEYCKLNNLKINVFINELLKKAFMREKYGEAPFNVKPKISTELNVPELPPPYNASITAKTQVPEIFSENEVVCNNENLVVGVSSQTENTIINEITTEKIQVKTKKRKLN